MFFVSVIPLHIATYIVPQNGNYEFEKGNGFVRGRMGRFETGSKFARGVALIVKTA